MTRASAGIARPADLRGKRIATVTASSAQFFLASWLLFHDIDPAVVNVVDMEPGTMAAAAAATAALGRREVDAAGLDTAAAAAR